jgi:hypothetical protein
MPADPSSTGKGFTPLETARTEPMRRDDLVPRDVAHWSPSTTLDAAFLRPELNAASLRLRRALELGMLLWPLGFLADRDVARVYGIAPATPLYALRAAILLTYGAAWLFLRARPPRSHALLRALTVAVFTATNVALGVMGATTGQMAGPYFGAVMVIMVVYAAVVVDRWSRAVWDAILPTLAMPVTLLVARAFSPALARSFADPVARSAFATDAGNVVIAYVLAVVIGHSAWALRRQVFAARTLGRYKLVSRIGEGGMGEIWRAHHGALKRDVAVKILRSDRSILPGEAVQRFEREVRATSELSHPNTVRVFDYGVTDDGLCYYAMELLDGENLGQLVAREGALAPSRAAQIVLQAARALAEAHAKGIIHRDVKPENLFVMTFGGGHDYVKVLDFGIARTLEEDITRSGWLVGTPGWIAPEILTGLHADARADVYALGAVLRFAILGERRAAAAPGEPTSGEGVAPALDVVIARAIAAAPADRYADAGELAAALASLEI